MTQMLDPELKPSPAKKIAYQSKSCLAVLVAAAVLIFGGYFVYDKGVQLHPGAGRGAGLPRSRQGWHHADDS